MGAPTEVYVDPAIAADSGTGTIGDPYGDLQYALNTVTPDATNGNRFNIKAGTAEILAAVLSYATYGVPSFERPAIFQGYTSSAGDGGIFEVNANAGAAFPTSSGIAIIDGKVHNGGTANLITFAEDCFLRNVNIYNTSGSGCVGASGRGASILGCEFSNIGTNGVSGQVKVDGCYFKNGTNDFSVAVLLSVNSCFASRNVFSLDGSSIGIHCTSGGIVVLNNSILSAGGTGKGIEMSGSPLSSTFINNLVEGFSGAGGVGYDLNVTTRYQGTVRNNAAYNNTTNFDIQGEFMDDESDNEALGASPFDKSGADTFANRFTYFAPVNTGNVRGGAFPVGCRSDKGAVQHSDPAGGGPERSLILQPTGTY